jgi:hypothetical protein
MKLKDLLESSEANYVNTASMSKKDKEELIELVSELDMNGEIYNNFVLDFANKVYKSNGFVKNQEPILIQLKKSKIMNIFENGDEKELGFPLVDIFDAIIIAGVTYIKVGTSKDFTYEELKK